MANGPMLMRTGSMLGNGMTLSGIGIVTAFDVRDAGRARERSQAVDCGCSMLSLPIRSNWQIRGLPSRTGVPILGISKKRSPEPAHDPDQQPFLRRSRPPDE